LGELAARGLITSDSFTGLRALLTPSNKRTPIFMGRRKHPVAAFAMEKAGRWALLPRETSLQVTEVPARGMATERINCSLLRRYGVVFRKILERETPGFAWRDLLRIYRRLEARGEIRGGRFVAGFSGEQFALPEAVTALRLIRRTPGIGQLLS